MNDFACVLRCRKRCKKLNWTPVGCTWFVRPVTGWFGKKKVGKVFRKITRFSVNFSRCSHSTLIIAIESFVFVIVIVVGFARLGGWSVVRSFETNAPRANVVDRVRGGYTGSTLWSYERYSYVHYYRKQEEVLESERSWRRNSTAAIKIKVGNARHRRGIFGANYTEFNWWRICEFHLVLYVHTK